MWLAENKGSSNGIKFFTQLCSMKDYKSYYLLNAEPEIVYKALTTPATIQLWSGYPAKMEPIPGTEFALFDGDIQGKNLELEPKHKIVQQWYFGEQEEPSIVTIKLHPHKQGTSAELRHTNIPDDVYEEFVVGWDETYFGSLQEFYED